MKKKKKQNDDNEKYRCFKVPITSILHSDTDIAERNMTILQDAISRANKITSKSYLLLRLWVLQKYHNDIVIPEVTTDTISMAMKSVMKSSSGPKPKGNNNILLRVSNSIQFFIRRW